MKKLLQLCILCISAYTIAQEAAHIIPNDAVVVASVKGQNLLQLISMDDINNSFIGEKILKDINRKGRSEYSSLEDFGLSLRASSHYFYQTNDSINYNAFVVPIKDVSKFEDFVAKQTQEELVTINGIRTFKKKENEAIVWNETILVMVKGSLSDRYFDEDEVMDHYGLKKERSYYYDDVAEAVEEVIEERVLDAEAADAGGVEEAEVIVEEVEVVDAVGDDVTETEAYKHDEEMTHVDDYYNDGYNDDFYFNKNIKTNLMKEWSLQQAIRIISQSENQSIVHNKAYQASLDNDAEATLWVKDFGVLYDNLLGNASYDIMTGLNIGSIYADTGLNAKLFAEDDRLELKTAYSVNDQWAKSYKKITSKKLNRKFFNYVNEDRMVGYMSYAIDTKASLQEYPAMMKTMYGNMPRYGEEARLAIDVFELFLDEEAVAKVFPGDMLFLLSGISEKEMTYTSYEYDDNYEYTEVEKTRTETVPDFLFMISTKDSRFLKKLIDYGVKKDQVVFENGIFSVKIPESPLDIHFIIKDDILFMGTSQAEMNKIARGNFDAKLSKKHKKLMRNSNYTMFLSGNQLASQIPMNGMSEKETSKISYLLTNASDAYIRSSRIKGNVIEAEMVVEVPNNEENSLKYMFKLIEELAK